MTSNNQNDKLLKAALILSFITIGYNFLEGGISVFFGLTDNTLALLGFGIDSFVEVVSGLGVAHMVLRMKYSGVNSRDDFERLALNITGTCFYILAAGLIAGSILNFYQNVKPDTTLPGLIVSTISILSMYWLMSYKLKVGRALNSDAIIADANCTRTCFKLSIILLASSLIYMFVRIGYIDMLGSLGIAFLSFKEGKESFKKARSKNLACGCEND